MRPGLTRADRIVRRRRLAVRAGLTGIALATACAATACIFDQGDYKGGGRLGRAATAEQEKQGSGEPPPDESSTDSPPVPDGG